MLTPLSQKCQSIVLGSILGDGCLTIHPKYRNARFSFRHSHNQLEYFQWKANELKEICSDKSQWIQGSEEKPDGWGMIKYRFQSLALPALTELHHLTHKGTSGPTAKIRRKWLNKLTPLSLAIWWLDDGSLVSDSRQGVLCTDSFSLNEVEILHKYLKNVWNVNTSIGQVKETGRYRLWIRSTEELKKFLRIIIPHVFVKSMLYKILLLYKDPILQERWISEVVSLGNFSEEVVIEQLNKKKLRKHQIKI
jgi:recombination protein RecA